MDPVSAARQQQPSRLGIILIQCLAKRAALSHDGADRVRLAHFVAANSEPNTLSRDAAAVIGRLAERDVLVSQFGARRRSP